MLASLWMARSTTTERIWTEMSVHPSQEESKDLEEAKAKVVKLKLDAFDYMASMLRYNDRDFVTSGYPNGRADLGKALEYVVRRRNTEIENIWKAHVKKYPD